MSETDWLSWIVGNNVRVGEWTVDLDDICDDIWYLCPLLLLNTEVVIENGDWSYA